MLDPEYLEQAGNLVCGVYSDIEADMCDTLVRAMLAGDISDWRSQTALMLLAQGQAPQLRMVLERHRGRINRAVREEVEAALERSDAHDLAIVKRALGVELPKVTTLQVAGVVRTVCQMLERDNVDLMSGARDAFFREGSWAVTQVASGLMSPDEAVRQATRRLARGGIDVVQYRDPTTGDKTVKNRVDVAVRRHIRSQLQQACANRTMQVCELTGCEFLEVSSHYGARPSHQDWEGRRYHVGGAVTVDGVRYEDFGEATGYYGQGDHGALGDRLCGVNCRHHFGPWFPGMPHAYEPNPKHPSGRSNAEIYELTQQQRRLERGIRDTKRELKAAERAYKAAPTLKNQAEANRVRESLKRQQERIAKLCEDNRDVLKRQANREGPIDTKRRGVPKGSGLTVDAYVAQPEVARRIEGAGISASAAKASLQRVASDRGIGRGFASLSARSQDALAREAILPKTVAGHRAIPVGGTFGTDPSPLAVVNMGTRLVPETEIMETAVFAGAGTSTEYRKRHDLCEAYGGEPWRWSHNAGTGRVFDPVDGRIRLAELHWAEEPSVGIRELRFKNWADQS